MNRAQLEEVFVKHDFSDFKWIEAKDIVVEQWVRFRCMFGCSHYGKGGACPPNVPSVQETRELVAGYRDAVIFHLPKKVEKPEDRFAWSKEMTMKLVAVEREVFLLGYYKAFLMNFDSCSLCAKCPGSRAACQNPKACRPGADALGVDVFATVRKAGYPIEVLRSPDETMNRYAFLLVE